MKKVQLVLCLALIPIFMRAQVDEFFEKYRDLEGATVLSFHGNFLKKMLSNEHDVEDKIKGLAELQILSIEEDLDKVSQRDISRLKSDLERSDLEELMYIRDNPTHVQILGREDGDYLREILMVVDDPDQFTLLRFQGKIRLKDVGDACSNIKVNGKNYWANLE